MVTFLAVFWSDDDKVLHQASNSTQSFNNKGDGSIYGETFRYLAHYNGSFYGQFEISQCLSNQADHSLHAINFLSEKNVHGRQSSHLLKPCSHL